MDTYRVAIVGGGPRGLGVLERLTAICAERNPSWGLHVHLIDPGEPGQGTHPSFQPHHLLTNTVAGQITLFADPSVRDAGPIRHGPSFLDWAQDAGYRRVHGEYVRTSSDGEAIHEDDYLPRALLGGYLTYVYDLLVRTLPRNVSLTHYRCTAEDVEPLRDGKLRIALAGGFTFLADCAVLTTGHIDSRPSKQEERLDNHVRLGRRKNPRLLYLRNAYPIGRLQAVSADAEVGIQGAGLTAYDIISELTVGRGGRFVPAGKRQLKYQASGREPRMTLWSRHGIPFSARGVNQKGIGGLHRAVFFTRAWIDAARRRSQLMGRGGKLDYHADIWPMLRKEMCFVYDTVRTTASAIDPAQYRPSAESERALSRIFAPLADGRFEDESAFAEALRSHIESDLAHAFGGNVDDPVKAATDVLRDLRDYVRYAVDYGGLTEESHRRFLDEVMPAMYRTSAGAPKERNMELLALLDAGLLSFGPGPNPVLHFDRARARFTLRSTRFARPVERALDVVIRARIDCTIYPEQQESALFRNMLSRGTLRPHMNGGFHPGGIDVDASQNVIGAGGYGHPNLWALGILTEGANWCTYVLPRAQVNSRFIQFSGRCALNVFAFLDRRHTRQGAVVPLAASPAHIAGEHEDGKERISNSAMGARAYQAGARAVQSASYAPNETSRIAEDAGH